MNKDVYKVFIKYLYFS